MKWFQNLKIKIKILLGFIIMAIFAIIVGLSGINNIYKIKNADQVLYKYNSLRLQYSGEAAINFTQLHYYGLKLITDKTQAAQKESNEMIARFRAETEAGMANLTSNIAQDVDVSADIVALNESIKTGWESYRASIDALLTAVGNKDSKTIDTLRASLSLKAGAEG
jgi:methyl-accepting chemotaxis protein